MADPARANHSAAVRSRGEFDAACFRPLSRSPRCRRDLSRHTGDPLVTSVPGNLMIPCLASALRAAKTDDAARKMSLVHPDRRIFNVYWNDQDFRRNCYRSFPRRPRHPGGLGRHPVGNPDNRFCDHPVSPPRKRHRLYLSTCTSGAHVPTGRHRFAPTGMSDTARRVRVNRPDIDHRADRKSARCSARSVRRDEQVPAPGDLLIRFTGPFSSTGPTGRRGKALGHPGRSTGVEPDGPHVNLRTSSS